MKYATHRGQKIAYEVTGTGPAVVFQHGFLSNRQSWKDRGYVERFADHYTTITVDSLGHGDSDKPEQPEHYTRVQRAADIAAVLDAERIDRAHYVGYSMGGWMGMGVLKYHPDRLLSLTLGGWDPVNPPMLININLDQFLELATSAAPELTDWITADAKMGLAGCLEGLRVADISADLLHQTGVPVHLWTGTEDQCCAALRKLHADLPGSKFTEVAGDHIGAVVTSYKESASGIRNFIDGLGG